MQVNRLALTRRKHNREEYVLNQMEQSSMLLVRQVMQSFNTPAPLHGMQVQHPMVAKRFLLERDRRETLVMYNSMMMALNFIL